MAQRSKVWQQAAEKIDKTRLYSPLEAAGLLGRPRRTLPALRKEEKAC